MADPTVFKRYEYKYLLTPEQKQKILASMEPYMALDSFGHKTIRNIYLDTDNYRLIRHSIEKPVYKEKLRIRSYDQSEANSPVYVELKKKYKHVVYKRRVILPECEAMPWICAKQGCPIKTQISAEIDYFLNFYEDLKPKVFISYERDAFYSMDASDFRVTFDENILCRQSDFSLGSEIYGTPLLPAGSILMEIKCSGGIPLWMVRTLSQEHIYKRSFSKYGTAYQSIIYPNLTEVKNHE